MRHRRRAYSLIILLAMLPLIAATSTAAWLLAVRVIKVQGSEQRYMQADASLRDLVRRFQADCPQAVSAEITQAGDLVLKQAGQSIVYRREKGDAALFQKVTRTASADRAAAITYAWNLPNTNTEFLLETVPGSQGVVWVCFTRQARVASGPMKVWRFAAAGAVAQWRSP
ncbi:MAG TPA: hypothetical protein VLM89_11635 [Phycisphaerae bacterium]|nr:hypothetical protein [Phycisphaerae bacterium]